MKAGKREAAFHGMANAGAVVGALIAVVILGNLRRGTGLIELVVSWWTALGAAVGYVVFAVQDHTAEWRRNRARFAAERKT